MKLLPSWTDKLKRREWQIDASASTTSITEPFNKAKENASQLNGNGADGHYLFQYWNGITSLLQSYGCTVLVAKVPPFATIETRAQALHNYISSQIPQLRKLHNLAPDEKVKINLIAHSMGGLDARYLICRIRQLELERLKSLNQWGGNNENEIKIKSFLKKINIIIKNRYFIDEIKNSTSISDLIETINLAETLPEPLYQPVSLTTISTPHHGTSAASFALKFFPPALLKFFPSITQLTPEYAKKFNLEIVNDPNVKYFSWGAVCGPSLNGQDKEVNDAVQWYEQHDKGRVTELAIKDEKISNEDAHEADIGTKGIIPNTNESDKNNNNNNNQPPLLHLISLFKPRDLLNPSTLLWFFSITNKIVNDAEGENDGLVSVSSSKWGQWKGKVYGVDHKGVIGWGIGGFGGGWGVNGSGLQVGEENTFKAKWMYLDIVNNLAIENL
ncbi:triglyceride lipase [Martiniozyma asiatica (nom. inval.)]|nr:triglyceride lipase [Martiniozyma asiatica]